MAVNRRYDILAVIVLVLCVVAYASFRTEYHLRPSMPREFFDPSQVPANKKQGEERVARAYWKCAVTEIQWMYGYAHRLPEQPPAVFSVTVADAGSAATDPATRARYWQKLRTVWGVSAVWVEEYGLTSMSLNQSMRSAGSWLEMRMRQLLGYT